MILDWFRSRKNRTNEDPTVRDANGNVLHTYDDVVLLRELQTDTPDELSFYRGTISAGTIGTIIIIENETQEMPVHLEFNIDHKLAFSHTAQICVRLHRRREEKLKHA